MCVVTGDITNSDKIIAEALCSPFSFPLAVSLSGDLGIQKSHQLIYTIRFLSPLQFLFFNEYWMYTDLEMMMVQNIFRFLKDTNFGKHCQHKKALIFHVKLDTNVIWPVLDSNQCLWMMYSSNDEETSIFSQFAAMLQFVGWYLFSCYLAESLYKQTVKFNWTTW